MDSRKCGEKSLSPFLPFSIVDSFLVSLGKRDKLQVRFGDGFLMDFSAPSPLASFSVASLSLFSLPPNGFSQAVGDVYCSSRL